MKLKQCIVQFENGSYSYLWINIADAIENKEVKIQGKVFNFDGKAKIIKVYHEIILDS